MDSSFDFDTSSDVGSDVGSDFESDVSYDSGFEGLDSVDDACYEALDEVSDIDFSEFTENIEMLDMPDDFCDDSDSEYDEIQITGDLMSLEDYEESEIFEVTKPEDIDELSMDELSNETVNLDPEFVLSGNAAQEFIETETDETADGESPMVLTRDVTPEIIESRERDTEEVLDNYRENLRWYGVSEEQIEEFVEQERDKINAEYERLDRGDTASNIYYQPTDWEELANSLTIGQPAQFGEEVTDEIDIEQDVEQANAEMQELSINYDEIYEEIQQEVLEESFADIHIDADPERLDNSLENFNSSTWESLTLDEQKNSMEALADYVVDVIGFENPPAIEYYNNEQVGDFGGYDSTTNTLHVNEYMLYNSDEAADTIAHELWHAHQHECAINPQSARDYQYQYNFENYIAPELGQEAYEGQLLEAEARAFAAQFKDRLSMIKGRQN